MKSFKHHQLLLMLLLALSIKGIGQEVLPEVTVKAIRYKYLSTINQKESPEPVRVLERRAAEYDIKSSDFYEEDYGNYFVSFYIPEGQILAAYDKDGKLLSTAEKYKDIDLPARVKSTLKEKYPEWTISHDVYLVNYHEAGTEVHKVYKLTLQKGDKRRKVKLNDAGEIL